MFRKEIIFFVLFLVSFSSVKTFAFEESFHFHLGQKYVDMEFLKRLSNSELLLDIFSTSGGLLYQGAVYTNDAMARGIVCSTRIALLLGVAYYFLRKIFVKSFSKVRQKIVDIRFVGYAYTQAEWALLEVEAAIFDLIKEPVAIILKKILHERDAEFRDAILNEIRGDVDKSNKEINAKIDDVKEEVHGLSQDCIGFKEVVTADLVVQQNHLFEIKQKIDSEEVLLNKIKNQQADLSRELDTQTQEIRGINAGYSELNISFQEFREDLNQNYKLNIEQFNKEIGLYSKQFETIEEDIQQNQTSILEIRSSLEEHKKMHEEESAVHQNNFNEIRELVSGGKIEKQNNDYIQESNKHSFGQIVQHHHMQKASVDREIPLDRSLEDVLPLSFESISNASILFSKKHKLRN